VKIAESAALTMLSTGSELSQFGFYTWPAHYEGEQCTFVQQVNHPEIIYEPGKCIDCALCIEIASKEGEKFGLTFVGRGFDVQVTVQLGRSMAEALERAGQKCVEACPTGALAFKDSKRRTNPP
jgi:NADH dehydrogenase/NADH:ubiquinone oxidoreductase subunit G